MSDAVNRRSFITASSAAIAAGAFAAPLAAADDVKPVTIGVMGLKRGMELVGSWAALPGLRIKYLCDVDERRTTKAVADVTAKGVHKPEGIGDFRRILDDPEVDALVCAAPNHWHAPATILACKAGKHVYVEKPCSHNPREGELMVESADKYKRCVQMGVQRRSSAGHREVAEMIRSGIIGRVYHARCYYYNLRESIGRGRKAKPPAWLNYDLWQGPAPRTEYVDNRIPYNWHWFWQWGNGELGNNGIHSLDICRWGLNVECPIKVTALGGRYRFEDDQQTADTHDASFEFDGKKSITWMGLSCNQHKGAGGGITFYGYEGTIEIDGSGSHTVYNGEDQVIRQEKRTNGDADHAKNFLNAVRANDPGLLNAEITEGHKSTLLCHLGNIALRTGRTLTCRSTDGHILGDDKAMELWQRDYEPGWEPTV